MARPLVQAWSPVDPAKVVRRGWVDLERVRALRAEVHPVRSLLGQHLDRARGWRQVHPVFGELVDFWHPQARVALVLDDPEKAWVLAERGVLALSVDSADVLVQPAAVAAEVARYLVWGLPVGPGQEPRARPRSVRERLRRSRVRAGRY